MNTLNIVAHPDDDLLFLNPDILRDFENNREPYLLYLTTGDDGRDTDYVLKRMDAVQYAWGPRMAGRQIFWNILDTNSPATSMNLNAASIGRIFVSCMRRYSIRP